jgi:hypothetical protein
MLFFNLLNKITVLQFTIITQTSEDFNGQPLYINQMNRAFLLDELYELKLPFYGVYFNAYDENGYRTLVAAFQHKSDLIEWMRFPLMKNASLESVME